MTELVRHLDWDGCFNARDLGGLRGSLGTIRRGALVRSDNLDDLTDAGWDELRAHGVETILDLRDPSERVARDPAHRPATIYSTLFDFGDSAFWDRINSGDFDGAAFYRATLERWPERFGHAVAAIADAPAGGVLVHCHVGRDRTGLVSALALAVAGVPLDAIAADYALSSERLRPRYAAWLEVEQDPDVRERLAREVEWGSRPEVIVRALDGVDVTAYLRAAGMTAAQLEALRARLLER